MPPFPDPWAELEREMAKGAWRALAILVIGTVVAWAVVVAGAMGLLQAFS